MLTRTFAARAAGALLVAAAALSCAHAPAVPVAATRPPAVADAEAPPLGRLPRQVVPASYELALGVRPREANFTGHERITIDIHEPLQSFFLHGRGLTVTNAAVVLADGLRLPATYTQVHEDGVARIAISRPVVAGRVVLELDWVAPFGKRSDGLFHVEDQGRDYAFTQFEALFARRAFPCFDEPSFKTPFEITVTIPASDDAVSNTQIVSNTLAPDGLKSIVFARTPPLPTYLVALAVGPLDIVTAPDLPPTALRLRPLPLRGVAVKGKGPQLAYILAHVGGIVETLETQFGMPFPFSKLDLIAVPDFAAGAMENAGAITFREDLLLADVAHMPAEQTRAIHEVAAHELAHQWFGDLVTMSWWDDLWLNEAFASWMASRTIAIWDPSAKADLEALDDVHSAMAADSLVTARQIRQPIISHHDIENAFDPITYRKGAGVIAMFERWLGPDKFLAGVHQHLTAFANRSATADDFLVSLSAGAATDIGGPFRSFLNQPGVPRVSVRVDCTKSPLVTLSQARSLPLGSKGDPKQTWEIPICLKFGSNTEFRSQCVLLTKPEETFPLDGACPTWVVPNSEGAGYYRFALDGAGWKALSEAKARLTTREQLAIADSLDAAFRSGEISASDYYTSLVPLAASPERLVFEQPIAPIRFARNELVPALAGRVEAFARKLYTRQPTSKAAFAPSTATDELKIEWAERAWFLVETARDPDTRKQAVAAGRALLATDPAAGLHLDAVEPSLVDLALAAAIEDGDDAFFDAAVRQVTALSDANLRRRLLTGLGHATGALGEKARNLTLNPLIHGNEMRFLLGPQFQEPSTRDDAWQWFMAHYDAFSVKMPEEFVGYVPWYSAAFCSKEKAAEVQAFFAPRIDALPGGPRNLSGALESIGLCNAQREAHAVSAAAYFQANP